MANKNLTYQPDELLANGARLLYDRATSAAYAAYGRLEWHLDEHFEDATQAAAAAYWEAHQRNRLDRYAWTAARYDALGTLIHHSVRAVSLDTPNHEGQTGWLERLALTPYYDPDTGHWLDKHDLVDLVKHLLARPTDEAVRYNAAILRLLATGYDNAAIAVELGRTEEAIKSTRAKLRRRLFQFCQERGIDTSHVQVKTGGWRPAHHYARMDNTAANRARWGGGHD